MCTQDMAQNSSISDAINHEGIKVQTDIHHQNMLSGKDITIKTPKPFFKNSYE